MGICFNTKGIIGLLPPLASVEYTIWSAKSKNTQSLRFALLFNLILWLIHDIYVGLYPAIIMDSIISIITIINIIRNKREY